MAVISEKAELVELLQEREHVIVQLAGETETIGGCRGHLGGRLMSGLQLLLVLFPLCL